MSSSELVGGKEGRRTNKTRWMRRKVFVLFTVIKAVGVKKKNHNRELVGWVNVTQQGSGVNCEKSEWVFAGVRSRRWFTTCWFADFFFPPLRNWQKGRAELAEAVGREKVKWGGNWSVKPGQCRSHTVVFRHSPQSSLVTRCNGHNMCFPGEGNPFILLVRCCKRQQALWEIVTSI